MKYSSHEDVGIILNDTTLSFKKIAGCAVSGKKDKMIYKFKKWENKPDSLNVTLTSRIFKSKWYPPLYFYFLM